ncbi:MAG: sulfotransferase [Gammaproteobacteria bacterium]|nr:sulfotransferase [Gammaproteobacteria bacterium]
MSPSPHIAPELFARANALLAAGDTEAAIELYRRVLALEPGASGVLNNLGLALQAAGDARGAADAFRRSVALSPANPAAQYNLGNALRALGEPRDAIAAYRRTLELDARNAVAHNNLGAVLLEVGEPGEALGAIERAIALAPDAAEAHNNLGLAELALGRPAAAALALRRCLELAPHYADALLNLGRVLELEGDADGAVGCYERAAALAPDGVDALTRHARLLESLSRLDEAGALVERGLAIAPASPELNLLAARRARREGRLDDAITRLESLARDDMDDDVRGAIANELGQLYDQRGEHDRAFACLREGNAHRARTARARGLDKDEFARRCRELTEAFLAEDGDRWPSAGGPAAGEAPIFMVGFPRSGTTLLEQILDAHPLLASLDEKATLPGVADLILDDRVRYPRALASVGADDVDELRGAYFRSVDEHVVRAPGTRVVDKLPLNILRVPLIWRLFPRAKIILSLRHPCDVVLSCYMQSFELNSAMANFLTLEDTARFYGEAMDTWRRAAALLPLDYHTVRYESLVDDLEGEARGVLEFLEVPWHDGVLEFFEHARRRGPISTPSSYQVTQPLYRRALERWRRYEKELAPVIGDLAPWIEHFGYAAD